MNELFSHYMEARRTSVVINPIGENQFSSPSRSRENWFYRIHYDGQGLPLCTCEAGKFKQPCCHAAATIAYVHPEIQRLWEHRRTYEANHRALLIRQGRLNPRKFPKIRKAMDEINERHPVTAVVSVCSRCGLIPAGDLCPHCCAELRKIWPGSPEFARELEREDKDEAMRLKLGVGE